MTQIFKGMKEFVAQQSDPDWRKENFDKSCRFLADALADIVREESKVTSVDYAEWWKRELHNRAQKDFEHYLEGEKRTDLDFDIILKENIIFPSEYVQKSFGELIAMESSGRPIAPVVQGAYLKIADCSKELRDGLIKALPNIFRSCPLSEEYFTRVTEQEAGFSYQRGKNGMMKLESNKWSSLSKACTYLLEEPPKTDFLVSGYFLDTVLAYHKSEQK
jgi:hypothetical protein